MNRRTTTPPPDSVYSPMQPQARVPDAVQEPLCHHRRRRVAGAGDRGEYRHLFAVPPAHPSIAAGSGAGAAGQPVGAGSQAGLADLQPGGRLRRRVQLPDVPRSRAGADVVHRHRRAPAVRRQPRLPRPDAERRRHARLRAATFPCSACSPRSAGCSARPTTARSARRRSRCSATPGGSRASAPIRTS